LHEVALVVDCGRDIGRLRLLWQQVPEGFRVWFVATGEAVMGEAGSAVRELTAHSERVRTVAMFDEGRGWAESVGTAVRGTVSVLGRLGVRGVVTYGATAGAVAAAFAAKLLALPHLHILRGDEDHPFCNTHLAALLASKTLRGPRLIRQQPLQKTASYTLCLLDPFNTLKFKRLYKTAYDVLAEQEGEKILICAERDNLALRPLKKLPNLLHRKAVSYDELLSALEKAQVFVTNTEVAFLEAKACGIGVIFVDEWGRRLIRGGERSTIGVVWDGVEDVWRVLASFKLGVERRGLRRG